VALACIAVGGGALRFATLGVQGIWFDEAVTAGEVRRSFTGMLSAIPGTESTPPAFYALLWPWTRVFGHGPAGLRSLSALAGTLTILVAFAIGRRLAGDRAGLLAALLVAANPLLIWYSQEARSYALLALWSALALWAALVAFERPQRRALTAWAVFTALALATHYFAVFPAAVEAAWLVHRHRRRMLPALLGVGAAGVALVPIFLEQAGASRAGFIHDSPLGTRLVQVPKQFLIGYRTSGQVGLGIVALSAATVALVLLARRGPIRPATRVIAVVVIFGTAVPAIGAVFGADYLISRNLIALLVPLLALLAAGWSAAPPRAGALGAAVIVAAGLVAYAEVETDQRDQRTDSERAARTLGAPTEPRVVLASYTDLLPLRLYLRNTRPIPRTGVLVKEAEWIGLTPTGGASTTTRPANPPLLPPAFRIDGILKRPTYMIIRWKAATPQRFPIGPYVGAIPTQPQPVAVAQAP
jgi:mannosyltransferase